MPLAALATVVLLLGGAAALLAHTDGPGSVGAASGCTSTNIDITFYAYGSATIKFGSHTYASGSQDTGVKGGCGQSVAVSPGSFAPNTAFREWLTTTNGYFADPESSTSTFYPGTTSGEIEMVVYGGPPPANTYGGFTASGAGGYQLRPPLSLPPLPAPRPPV